MKTLLFFTAQFPFGKTEAFIESEFPFLVKAFERIIIITNDLTETTKRPIPDNVDIIRIPNFPDSRYKLQAVLKFFGKDIQEELSIVKKQWPDLSLRQILPVLLASYGNALSVNDFLKGVMTKYKLEAGNTYIYSYWTNDMASGVALFKRENPEVRAFSRAHRWDLYFEFNAPPYLPLRQFIFSNLDVCYSISEDGMNYLNAVTGNRLPGKIQLSQLGTFNYHNTRSCSNAKKIKLVSCSSIYFIKRVGLIIEALALIKDIEVEWIHFGDGPMMKEVEEQAKNKLTGKVNYVFAGMTENTKVLQYYANECVDLFINVSESEGIPVSIMEAHSFGIPVIATNVGGMAEIIIQGVNGELLPPHPTAAEVAAAIEKFYRLPEEKKSDLRNQAYNTWSERFNAEKNYQEFIGAVMAL